MLSLKKLKMSKLDQKFIAESLIETFNFAGKESPYLLARISNSFLKFSKSLTSKPLGKITSPNESSWDAFSSIRNSKEEICFGLEFMNFLNIQYLRY